MSEQHNGTSWLVGFAAFIIIIAGLKAASQIVIPFMLSVFIAIICAPLMSSLRQRKVPTWLAIILVVMLILVGIGSLAVLVGASLDNFSSQLPSYKARFAEETSSLIQLVNSLGLQISYDQVKGYIDPSALMQMVANALRGLGSALTNLILVVMIVIFILFEAVELPKKLSVALNDASQSLQKFESFIQSVNRYLVIKTLVSILTGVLITLWLWVIGVDFPILWGVCAFLLNFVPNIGSIIAAVPAVLLAFVQLGSLSAGLTAAGFLAVNLIIGNVIEPRYMGKGLGLSTLVVFLSLLLWGWVFGPVGMLLSIPLTIIMKLAFEAHPKMQWLAVMIDSDSSNPRR
ncbi:MULTISPECIES: AI-2E family transporter [Marinomonas]|uniref:AI-2E family transporter n=1 Tax=Marinomonas arctica TaxID=383750 RepID=A0A7H1JB29_9GAMM|nr:MULTISPECIES: AI-2E family transporter [Marinomonas]MCS7486798.1 membrane protein [Marinomonas sp. BSi20414]QNT07695.1 AI-2E family transporter [Marinomonas arctica]GGN21920.1 membrane protein [Marinomonas arctica]